MKGSRAPPGAEALRKPVKAVWIAPLYAWHLGGERLCLWGHRDMLARSFAADREHGDVVILAEDLRRRAIKTGRWLMERARLKPKSSF